MKQQYFHLKLTQNDLRRINNSTGDFRPRAACGNGSGHALLTSEPGSVTCPVCLEYQIKGKLL